MARASRPQAHKHPQPSSHPQPKGAPHGPWARRPGHGTRQRLAIAASPLHEPQVIIIDEPMVGLDPVHVRVVKDELKARAHAGATIFMSTHLLNIAEELADRIGIIDGGQLVALGNMAELRQLQGHGQLEQIFLSLLKDPGDDRH